MPDLVPEVAEQRAMVARSLVARNPGPRFATAKQSRNDAPVELAWSPPLVFPFAMQRVTRPPMFALMPTAALSVAVQPSAEE